MIHPRTTGLLAAVLLSALLLAGCGGGGGEPTVSQGVHDLLQHDLDNTLAELRAEREAKAREAAARRTAQGEVTRLNTELSTAKAEATRLEGVIGAATDTASDAVGASLHAQLNHATAEAARLGTLIGSMDDAASDADSASLHARLNAANAKVATLEAQVGAATDAADASATASLHAQLNAANGEVTRLRGMIGNASDTASDAETASLHAQLNAAKARASELETLVGDAVNPVANSLRGQLAAAQAQVARLSGRVTTAEQEVEEAEQEAQQARQEAAQAQQQAQQQANINLRAPKLLAALAGLTEAETESATVTHGSSPKVVPQGNYSRQSSAPGISGFGGDILTKKIGNTATDTVYLYTNIKAPGNRAFWKVHGTSFTMGTGSEDVRASGSRATHTVDGTTPANYSELEIDGHFDGARGTFNCETGCTGVIDDGYDTHVTFSDGKPTFVSGTWIFEPNSLTAGVTQRVGGDDTGERQDSEFLYFGIWSREPNDASVTTPAHDVKWIGGGDGVGITAANFAALTGQAKFVGGAVGRYALTNQVGQADRIGTFTATAEFTADFGATETLEGDITDFREGGRSLGSDWNVYLGADADGSAELGETGIAAQTGGAIASIGGVDVIGDWNATLHGSDNVTTGISDLEDYTAEKYPAADLSGVQGWFEAADTSVGVGIAGAFGAACITGTMCAPR